MKAMILAAGLGTRMLSLTAATPKPLLQAGDRSLIEWQLHKLRCAGISEVVINHHHLGAQIEQALGDGQRYGLTIRYSPEPERLETAGGIIRALPLLQDDSFIIVNADVWTDFDFSTLQPLNPDIALAHLVMVPNANHHPQGDFHLKNTGLVSETGIPRHTYSGISVLHRRLFVTMQAQYQPLSPLLREAMASGLVKGQIYKGEWRDIGTPERLQQLDAELSARNTNA